MSPEQSFNISAKEKAIKPIDRQPDQLTDPHVIALPVSTEGHIIEGSIDELIYHPNAIDGLQHASKTFWEAQGFDKLSVDNNLTMQTEQVQTMLERLNPPEDLQSLKKKEKAAVVERMETARKVLYTIFRETHANYTRLVESVQTQPERETVPVTIFSAQDHQKQEDF